jgi:hypothetical protein
MISKMGAPRADDVWRPPRLESVALRLIWPPNCGGGLGMKPLSMVVVALGRTGPAGDLLAMVATASRAPD